MQKHVRIIGAAKRGQGMRIKPILFILLLSLGLVPSLIMSFYTYQTSKSHNLTQSNLKVGKDLDLLSYSLLSEINSTKKLVKNLIEFPPVQPLLDSNTSQKDFQNWKARFERILYSTAQLNPNIFQLRIIKHDGLEVVRINQQNNGIQVVPKEQLQNKAKRSYFGKTMSLQKGEVYVSPIELNQEYGKIDKPRIATIRIATPIYLDSFLMPQGIFIINVNLNSFFEEINLRNKENEIFLVSSKNEVIYHNETKNTFSEKNIFPEIKDETALNLITTLNRLQFQHIEFPQTHDQIAPNTKSHPVQKGAHYYSYFEKIYFQNDDNAENIYIVKKVPKDQIFKSSQSLLYTVIVSNTAILIIIILMIYYLSQKLIFPISQLIKNTKDIASLNKVKPLTIEKNSLLEIEELSESINQMNQNISDSSKRLLDMYAEKEII